MAIGNCGTCRFGVGRTDDLTMVDCYGAPPHPVVMPVGPNQVQVQFIRPMMKRTERGCGCHQPLDLIMMPEPADAPVSK